MHCLGKEKGTPPGTSPPCGGKLKQGVVAYLARGSPAEAQEIGNLATRNATEPGEYRPIAAL